MTEPCPTCRATISADLRAQAEKLLDVALSNERNRRPGNRDWCYRAAFGYLRAAKRVETA